MSYRIPWSSWLLASLLLLLACLQNVCGHGRLMEPPARNAMWRFGYPNPVNYNDNELFCGGYAVQWEQNQGNCGVCGDAANLKVPRPHEAGGDYGKGIISRRYTAGQEINVTIELTANHYGRFEMYLCPNNDARYEATQECFNKYPLYLSNSRELRYIIPKSSQKQEAFTYTVKLPRGVTCTQCVLQWTYYTGNMWGRCSNGTEAVGCGKAETFRNCADVSITSNVGAGIPPAFVEQKNPFLLYYKDLRQEESEELHPLIIRDQFCGASEAFSTIPGMDDWCQANCLHYPPYCPEDACTCPTTCEAIGDYEGREGADVYCLYHCFKANRSNCPTNRCRCFKEDYKYRK